MPEVIPASLKPNDFESVTMTGSALSLDSAKVAASEAALIQFQGGDGYYRMDGTAPVAGAGGGLFSADGAAPLFLERVDLSSFKAIATAGVELVVHYLS